MGKKIERLRGADGNMYEVVDDKRLSDTSENRDAEDLLAAGEIRSADGKGVVQRAYTGSTTTANSTADADLRAKIKRELLLELTNADFSAHDRNEDASEKRYDRAFGQYVRRGFKGLTASDQDILMSRVITDIPDEARALSVGTGSSGGFTVPQGFVNDLRTALEAYGGLRAAPVTKLVTGDGADLPYPTGDDTGNTGELLAENTQAATADPAFGQVTLKSFMWSSKLVRVSFQLMQDSAFDMEAWLAAQLGKRIGRAQAGYLITGTGTGQPEGIITGATVGHTTASTQVDTLLYTDVVALRASVDRAYRSNGVFVVSDDAEKELLLIVDQQDRPIWNVNSMQTGEPDRLLGHPVYVDNELADLAASAKPMLFGDISEGYVIRDVGDVGLIRFDERYADYLQVGFLAFQRSDGRQVVADGTNPPYKVLQMAAS